MSDHCMFPELQRALSAPRSAVRVASWGAISPFIPSLQFDAQLAETLLADRTTSQECQMLPTPRCAARPQKEHLP